MQAKSFYEKLEVTGEQGDATDKQFAFPRQFLVLGDSGVGKTSLVKSLTGNPFDLEQPKTQGIDQSLVDNEWKSCNLTELVFGDLWRFLKTGDVEVSLKGLGRGNSPVVVRQFEIITGLVRWIIYFYASTIAALFVIGTLYTRNLSVAFLLFYFIYYGHLIFQCYTIQASGNLRFILATFIFILSRRGLIVGLYLGLRSFHMFGGDSVEEFASTRTLILLGTVVGIAFVAVFVFIGPLQLPFDLCKLVKNQNLIVILCYCRLPLSIFIGSMFGLVVGLSFTRLHLTCDSFSEAFPSCQEYTGQLIYNLLSSILWEFPIAVLETRRLRTIIFSIKEKTPWVIFVTLLIVVFFLYKLAWDWPEFYFQISFPLYIVLTIHQEWFCIHSLSHDDEHMDLPKSFLTLELMGNGEINTKLLKGALKEKFPSLKLKIFDFAGDREYYSFHHVFLKSCALYVIVFNIAKLAEDNFQNVNSDIERLKFWLESVCSHVPPKTPIFLVGTHRGHFDKICMKMLNSHLQRGLWKPFCDELVVNDVDELIFFPVENSKGDNDVGVQSLRIKVMSVAEEREPARECDIPLSWIAIQDAIISLRDKKKAKFCVTLEEFPTAFNRFICNNWSKETLKYFHEKGLVIYLDRKDRDLSNWVLLKPEILVDIIIQLVTPPPQMIQERGFRRDWELLHDKGILTKSLLTRIISTVQENKKAMTAFLEEYDLICPLSNAKVKMCSLYDDEEQQPTHFVPSLLPMSADGSIPTWLDNTTDKKFYVFFKRFLPEPLFHRLLSRAHTNSKLQFPNGPVVMFKDVGKFWMSPKQPCRVPYRLKLMKEEAIIEVTFSSR